MDKRIEKLLEVLERREDKHFEGFCQALEDTDQSGVVERYLQEHLVCISTLNTSMMQSCKFVIENVLHCILSFYIIRLISDEMERVVILHFKGNFSKYFSAHKLAQPVTVNVKCLQSNN